MRLLVLLALLAAGTMGAAELLDTPFEIYAGAAGGALMGVIGYLFGREIEAQHKRSQTQPVGGMDIWTIWIAGFTLRLLILAGLAGIYIKFVQNWRISLLALTAVYMVLLFSEAWWMMRNLIEPQKPVKGA